MEQKTVHSVFFSPTGTSRAIALATSRGIRGETEAILDMTCKAPDPSTFSKKDVVVVAMPVYGGRIPKLAVKRFQSLKGNGTPVAALVVYGNRAYEDALLELCDLCMAQGFQLAGAAAFVGQHSFSSTEFPIAANRPDPQDLGQAEAFGRQLRDRLDERHFPDLGILPGNHPYKSASSPGIGATDTHRDDCIQCGACAASCPVPCIEMVDGFPQTQSEDCIWCMACIRACPTPARIVTLPKIGESAQRLHTHFQARREPEIF